MCTMAIPIPDTGCGERRVLFVHDGPIYVGPDGSPRGVHYTDALIDRYMQLGPHLTFLLRSIPVPQQDADRYSPLRRDGFRFFSVPNVKSISAHVTQGRLVRPARLNAPPAPHPSTLHAHTQGQRAPCGARPG